MRWAPDLATAALALALAATFGASSFAALVLAFFAAWLLVELAMRRFKPDIEARGGVTAMVAIGVLGAVALARDGTVMLRAEGLTGLDVHLADRSALSDVPAIHPRLVVPNRPTTYFVYAPGGAEVVVSFGGQRLEGEALGHGVFRVELDVATARQLDGRGDLEAGIAVDGRTTTRTMRRAAALTHPRALHTSPDGRRVCVASEETDEVFVLDATGEPERFDVLGGPSDCGFLDDGNVVVTRRFADAVLVVGGGDETRSYEVGEGACALAVDEAARRIVVLRDRGGRGEIVVVSPDTGGVIARADVPGTPDFVELDSVGALLVASRSPARIERWVVRDDGLVRAADRALAMPAVATTTAHDGRELLVATTAWNERGAPGLGNHFAEDTIATLDARTLELIRSFPTGRRSERQDHAGDLDRGLSPLGMAFDADGALFVACAGSDEITRIPGGRGDAIGTETWDTAALGASAPVGIAALRGGTFVASSPSSGVLVVFMRDAEPRTIRLAPDDGALLRAEPEALRARMGERAFFEATRSGVSCQTCHTHGGTDGAAHNIGGRVLAPTLDTRGITSTSPYLRDGSYPRIGDLLDVAESEYRGYRLEAGDRRATIEGYLETLPARHVVRTREPESERRGLDVFFGAGCPDCHAPPAFTGLGEHPIAAVFPDVEAREGMTVLDAPSLRGVVASAPYLFDGRAATLNDVLTTANGSDAHGHTASLTDEERADLLTFLESL